MFKKIFLSFLTLAFLVTGVFLFVSITKAVEVKKTPAENSLCWTRQQCTDIRKDESAFLEGEGECTGNVGGKDPKYAWGKCLAGKATSSSVAFGGKASFLHIGDYIKTVYNYALIILAILASIMIVVAGIQYISSAGSQEMISSAKKKIGGALIGLALAYMSYTILNMINPATINLRLPQVYMIREIALTTWCSEAQVPPDVNFSFVQTPASLEVFKKIDDSNKQSTVSNKMETKCGAEYSSLQGKCIGVNCNKYTIKDDSLLASEGDAITCDNNENICSCVAGGNNPSGYMCVRGLVGGNIKLANTDHYVDDLWLYPVCKKGSDYYFAHDPGGDSMDKFFAFLRGGEGGAAPAGYQNIPKRVPISINQAGEIDEDNKNYSFPISTKDIESYCGYFDKDATLAGFLIAIEIYDCKLCEDDKFLIGSESCNKTADPLIGSENLRDWIEDINDENTIYPNKELRIRTKKMFENNLLSYTGTAINCDITIDNNIIKSKMELTSKSVWSSGICFWPEGTCVK